MQRLRPGSLLKNNRYRIERDLGQGGFGITYLAFDMQAKRKVAIKEYFAKLYSQRDQRTQDVLPSTKDNASLIEIYKKKFVKEAETCRNLSHTNIVEIYDSFEEHQTAYFVMDYVDGGSLEDILKEREIPGTQPKKSTPFSQDEALSIIRYVGAALMYIHSRNISHLDVKPGNIMRRKSDGHIFLIDFGVAKQYDKQSLMGDTNTPVGVSPGYSPMEQYRTGGVQTFSPQSDVYSLAATLFKFLTGIRPPEPAEFFDRGLPIDELKSNGVSQHIIDAICQAMLTKDKRTQSVSQFIDQLNETNDDLTEVWVEPDDPQMQMQPEEPNTTWFHEHQNSSNTVPQPSRIVPQPSRIVPEPPRPVPEPPRPMPQPPRPVPQPPHPVPDPSTKDSSTNWPYIIIIGSIAIIITCIGFVFGNSYYKHHKPTNDSIKVETPIQPNGSAPDYSSTPADSTKW